MSTYINLNGKLLKSEEVFISPNNRSFRYGDGFFDTMRYQCGQLVSGELHMQRMQASLNLLQFDTSGFPNVYDLGRQVQQLALQNAQTFARIRCTVFRGDGALHDNIDNSPNYLIQSWQLEAGYNSFNRDGLTLGIYDKARKTADEFSAVKSNNFLCYVMAALDAKSKGLSDCFLLNTVGNITDSTIANVFAAKNNVLTTPPLTEGPVAGIMRRYLLSRVRQDGIEAHEGALTPQALLDADEVFLTNALFGIRWIKRISTASYSCKMSSYLYERYIRPLFTPHEPVM